MKDYWGALLAKIFETERENLRRRVRLIVGDENDAQDIVQEAFIRLYRVVDPENIENPKAYLRSTVHNLAINGYRQKKRRRWVEGTSFDDLSSHQREAVSFDAPSPEAATASRQELQQVIDSIEQLSPQCQKVFLLHKFKGMSYAEIAREMNISERAVEYYMAQVFAHLRRCLP